jgi:hypothetical protein
VRFIDLDKHKLVKFYYSGSVLDPNYFFIFAPDAQKIGAHFTSGKSYSKIIIPFYNSKAVTHTLPTKIHS